MNPLYSNSGFPNMGRLGNMSNMLQQFNQFKQSFKGDPKQTVLNMLSNGQMSKGQFEQLSQLANQFGQLFK